MTPDRNLRLLYRITAAGVVLSAPASLRAQDEHEGHSHEGEGVPEGPVTLKSRLEPFLWPAIILVVLLVYAAVRNARWRRKMGA